MKKLTFFDQKHRKNAIFGTFIKFLFLWSKKRFFFLYKVIKHFFHSYFDQIHIKKKLAFFDQKHVLTPLENATFRTFKNFCFYSEKEVLLYLEHY